MRESTLTTAPPLSQHQMVREFQETCEPRQRVLLGLLAICQKHNLAPTRLVASLAQDLSRTPVESRKRIRKFYASRVYDFSEELKQAQAIPDGLEKFPGLLPDTVELALRLEQEKGTLGELNNAWLNRSPDYIYDLTRNDSFVSRLFPLFLKTFVILSLTNFVMLFLVPEFKSMLEEFDVAIPPIFQLTVKIANTTVGIWSISVLLFIIAIPFCIPAIKRYAKRWNPYTWQQPVLPKAVSTRQALALVTGQGGSNTTHALTRFSKLQQALDGNGDKSKALNEKRLDWDELALQGIISRKEAQALEMTDSDEVRAWLLAKSAITQNHGIESRRMFFTRAFVTTVNVLLGALVFLVALSVFSTLIHIMSHLN